MAVSMADITKLRKMTGAGMMDFPLENGRIFTIRGRLPIF